jgi:hypothetical protein
MRWSNSEKHNIESMRLLGEEFSCKQSIYSCCKQLAFTHAANIQRDLRQAMEVALDIS